MISQHGFNSPLLDEDNQTHPKRPSLSAFVEPDVNLTLAANMFHADICHAYSRAMYPISDCSVGYPICRRCCDKTRAQVGEGRKTFAGPNGRLVLIARAHHRTEYADVGNQGRSLRVLECDHEAGS